MRIFVIVGLNPINTNDNANKHEFAIKVIFRPNFSAKNPPKNGANKAPIDKIEPIQDTVSGDSSSLSGLTSVSFEDKTGIIGDVHPIDMPPIKLVIFTKMIVQSILIDRRDNFTIIQLFVPIRPATISFVPILGIIIVNYIITTLLIY